MWAVFRHGPGKEGTGAKRCQANRGQDAVYRIVTVIRIPEAQGSLLLLPSGILGSRSAFTFIGS